MKRLREIAILLLFTMAATAASAQVRGEGRLAGKVLDQAGKPMADVQVKATMTGQTQPMTAKTNNKGEWAINGLAGGEWVVEFTKTGFDPQSGKVKVDESARSADISVTLAKHVEQVDPSVELNDKAKEGLAMLQGGKNAEGRKVFEDLLAKYPTVHQLNVYIAQSYVGENNIPKAVEYMRAASEKDPANAELKLAYADLLMEQGDKAGALDIMLAVDVTQVKNPLPFINGSIALINDKKADVAIELLNKVVTQFPTQAETYYYRGRAYVAAQKLPEAKADLEKFVAMAPPEARELADARKILEQLKTAK